MEPQCPPRRTGARRLRTGAAACAFLCRRAAFQAQRLQVLYLDRGNLALNDGVVPYDLNTPLFSDYAHKLRTIWMPRGRSAKYSADGGFEFPVGTIITKTFYYPRPKAAARDQKAVARTYDQSADFGRDRDRDRDRDRGLKLANVHL